MAEIGPDRNPIGLKFFGRREVASAKYSRSHFALSSHLPLLRITSSIAMAERLQLYTTPPTSPPAAFVTPRTPVSPRGFTTFPLVPPAGVANHPRHATRHVPAPVEYPFPPATLDLDYAEGKATTKKVLLELADGSSFTGFSFGADKSVSGELVFQTGTSRIPFFRKSGS